MTDGWLTWVSIAPQNPSSQGCQLTDVALLDILFILQGTTSLKCLLSSSSYHLENLKCFTSLETFLEVAMKVWGPYSLQEEMFQSSSVATDNWWVTISDTLREAKVQNITFLPSIHVYVISHRPLWTQNPYLFW